MKMLVVNNKALVVNNKALVVQESRTYQRLSKLTFSGSAYFDSGYVCKDYDLEVEVICSVTNTTTGPNVMWGFMSSSSYLPRWMIGTYNNGWLTSLNTTSYTSGGKDNNVHTFVNRAYLSGSTPNWSTYIDGDLYRSGAVPSAAKYVDNTLSSYIGGRNNGGTGGNTAQGDFVSLRITVASATVQEIYPVVRLADSVVGLYDTVSQTFIQKQGSGSITAGTTMEIYY